MWMASITNTSEIVEDAEVSAIIFELEHCASTRTATIIGRSIQSSIRRCHHPCLRPRAIIATVEGVKNGKATSIRIDLEHCAVLRTSARVGRSIQRAA